MHRPASFPQPSQNDKSCSALFRPQILSYNLPPLPFHPRNVPTLQFTLPHHLFFSLHFSALNPYLLFLFVILLLFLSSASKNNTKKGWHAITLEMSACLHLSPSSSSYSSPLSFPPSFLPSTSSKCIRKVAGGKVEAQEKEQRGSALNCLASGPDTAFNPGEGR